MAEGVIGIDTAISKVAYQYHVSVIVMVFTWFSGMMFIVVIPVLFFKKTARRLHNTPGSVKGAAGGKPLHQCSVGIIDVNNTGARASSFVGFIAYFFSIHYKEFIVN